MVISMNIEDKENITKRIFSLWLNSGVYSQDEFIRYITSHEMKRRLKAYSNAVGTRMTTTTKQDVLTYDE